MKHSRSSLFAMFAVCLIAALHATPNAGAQDTKWNVGSGSFHNAANWSDGIPDANTDTLFFSKTGTVDFTGNAASKILGVVSESNIVFALGGHTYAVTELQLSLNSALTLQDGTFSATSASIAGVAFGPSTLTVGNGAMFQVGAGGLIVGTIGEANFVIANGGMATAQSLLVSTTPGGSGFVNVQAGGTLNTGSATLGLIAGTDAKANVAGSWTNTTSMIIGSGGLAELNIGHDGMASTGTGGSVSTLSLTVGASAGGEGTINLGEDATLVSTIATIASATGTTGTVNVGDGATWTNHNLVTVGALVPGSVGGNAEVNIGAGGLFHSLNLSIGNGATVTQTGTGAIALASTGIGNAALNALIDGGGLFVASNSLTIVNGGLLEATRAFIDSLAANDTATATVSGMDSLLDLDGGDLVVGGTNNGTLNVAGGGKVASGDSVIGENAGASGSVTVSGQDANENPSQWEITGALTVGDEGNGTLSIAAGALVNTTGDVDISSNGGQGDVLVTGEDSLLDVGGDLRVGFDDGLGHAADEGDATGILNVSGGGVVDVAGGVTVNETGILAGDGTIIAPGNVVVHGILRPGNPTGTLNITGTLTLEDGSTFLVSYIGEEIDGQPGVLQSGMADVDGDANIHAGTLVHLVKVGGGPVQEGDQLIILHADNINIVAGDLEDIVVQDVIGSFIGWVLSIEPAASENLVLTAQFLEDEFFDIVETLSPNFQAVVDAALEVPDIKAGLFSLTEDDLAQGIQSLMPLQHGTAAAHRVRTAQITNNSFLGQMAAGRAGIRAAGAGGVPGMFAGSAIDPAAIAQVTRSLHAVHDADLALGAIQDEGASWGGFFQGIGVWDRVDSDSGGSGDRIGHRARVFGGHVGIHNHASPEFLLGLSFAYLNTDLDFRDNFGEGEIHTFRIGPYLSWTPGGGDLFIDASATYGYHRNEIDRNVLVPVPGTATGKYDAHDISILGLAGYDFRIFEGTVLTPMIGAEYTHLRTNSFRESGSGANLNVDSHTLDSLRLRAGAKLAHAIVLGEHTIVPEVYGGWAHEFLDRDIDLRSRFLAGGPSFTTRTAGVGRGALQVGAGVTAMAGTYITLYVRYEGEFQSDRRAHGVVGGLNINF